MALFAKKERIITWPAPASGSLPAFQCLFWISSYPHSGSYSGFRSVLVGFGSLCFFSGALCLFPGSEFLAGFWFFCWAPAPFELRFLSGICYGFWFPLVPLLDFEFFHCTRFIPPVLTPVDSFHGFRFLPVPTSSYRLTPNAGAYLPWNPRIQVPTPDSGSYPRIPVPTRIPAPTPDTPDSGSYPGFRCLPRIPVPTPDSDSYPDSCSYPDSRIPVPTPDSGSYPGFRLLPRIPVPTPDSGLPRIPVPTPDSGSYPGFRFLPRIRIRCSPRISVLFRIPVPTPDSGAYPGFRCLPRVPVTPIMQFGCRFFPDSGSYRGFQFLPRIPVLIPDCKFLPYSGSYLVFEFSPVQKELNE